MKNHRAKIVGFICCGLLLVSPFTALAQTAPTSNPPTVVASTAHAAIPSLEELGLVRSADAAPRLIATPPPNSSAPTTPANSGLSLDSLGFSSTQTQSNAALQARLNKRTHMLKIHQKLGVITLAPMLAAVLVSGGAKSKMSRGSSTPVITPPSDANVDLHIALGSLTAGLYGATAYFAIAAPKIPGTQTRGAIRVHKYLTLIHGPGMILTPMLGEMALSQEESGQKVHGIASAHSTVAAVTVIAYTASIVAVSWPIHLKLWH
jgi:hypothetical protein